MRGLVLLVWLRAFMSLFVCVCGGVQGVHCRGRLLFLRVCVCGNLCKQPHVTVTRLPNFFWCHKPPSLSPAHGLTQKPASCP